MDVSEQLRTHFALVCRRLAARRTGLTGETALGSAGAGVSSIHDLDVPPRNRFAVEFVEATCCTLTLSSVPDE
jgi:hypothetical protein